MAMTPMTALEPMKQLAAASENSNIKTNDTGFTSFEDSLQSAISGVKELEDTSNKASYDLAVGNTDDLTSVMLAATKAQTAIQMTTQITSKAVSAYKEIMQMNL